MNNLPAPELLFYQNLGELFYAVAATDKVVRKVEYEALAQLVEEQWQSMDDYEDEFGTDAAYQIAIVFEWFDYEQMEAKDCFEDFTHYYKHHKNMFSQDRKDLIVKTVRKIANAFAGTNKSELILITKLEMLFSEEA